ncbi:MAG TPA: hypothetical protein VF549_13450 [Solirubrobacteraceae bacterium]|jgi:hypothetical protein
MRRSLLLLAFALLLAPAPARAVTVGLSDQTSDAWQDGRLRALGLRHARLVVPWNAAITEPDRVAGWLAASAAAGFEPHVAFEHGRDTRCPASPCVYPTRAAYARAVRAFAARFPQVRTYTTWNEANHRSQPVAALPGAVAGYYEELVAACPGCTVVAADVLDSGAYVRWLQRFRAATGLRPRLWGLHNYADVTYGRTTGTDRVLAAVPGRLWIEETGGIVAIRGSALTTDEGRAARSIARAFALAAARPRITRMYVYHWRASASSRLDAGLVRADGTARPSLVTLAAQLGAQRAPLRWTAHGRRTRLVLRARCRVARCRGRVAVRLGGRRIAMRGYRTSAAQPTATLRLRVPRALRRVRRVRLTVRAAVPSPATSRVSLLRS